MDCELPAVFEALSGQPPLYAEMVTPPPNFPRRAVPPPAAGKGTYGTDLPYHLDGENFTVQWADGGIDPDRAQAILDAAEEGWAALIERDGWPAPVSSDRWRLWILLDRELGGSGYTTLYTSDDYPDGYPVARVNPDYLEADDPDFALSVTVHEFGHMIQYGLRDWDARGPEAWYWEASAEWLAERGAPEIDTYAWSSYWYAVWPDANVDNMANGHPYGLFIISSWIEEFATGADGVRDAWVGSGGAPWTDVLAASVDMDFGALIREVAGTYAADGFRESHLFYDPVLLDTVTEAGEWEADIPGLYGTHYLYVDSPAGLRFYADGEVLVGFAQDGGWSDEQPAEGPYVATVTTVGTSARTFTYGLTDAPVDTGDPGDTGGEGEAPQACGCATRGAAPGWLLVGAATVLLARRRR